MNYGIIYKATGPTGKIYIGQTVGTLSARKSAHAYRAKKGDYRTAFQIALLDEGFSNFTWEQIDTAETQEELDQKEKHYIALYDSMNPDKGYNGTGGGIHFTMSQKNRKKLSERMKGQPGTMTGKHHTEEAKGKMSAAKMGEKNPNYGKPVSEETKRRRREAGGLRKLTPDNVREIRKLLETIGYRKIAKLFNVDMRVIYKIRYGMAYAWVKNEEAV
jgi:group I intron endonuclease